MEISVKLLNEALVKFVTSATVITEREAYMQRFEPLRQLMMKGVGALHDQGESWFMNVDYAKLSLTDIEWISDEFNVVPNGEYGESVIEDAYPEDAWRDALLKGADHIVTLPTIQRLPAVRLAEDYF